MKCKSRKGEKNLNRKQRISHQILNFISIYWRKWEGIGRFWKSLKTIIVNSVKSVDKETKTNDDASKIDDKV